MKKIIFVAICLTFAASSCLENIICIDGNGQFTAESRDITELTGIVNTTSVDVVYRKADSVSITITSESNLMEHIITSVSGGRLEIKTDPENACFEYTMKPKITVTSPQLNSIDLTGSGPIEADTLLGTTVEIRSTASGNIRLGCIIAGHLKVGITGSGYVFTPEAICNEADFTVTGSGNMQISGKSEKGTMRVTGNGYIKSNDLMITIANETITGSGNIFSTVLNTLNAVISGSGNIYVKGNPTINQTITGSGRVIRDQISLM